MPRLSSGTPLPLVSLHKSIVLVGLMGAGKSTIGRRLAQVLDAPFTDSDNEIVEAAGCSIADIFEIHGEEIFRDLEQRILIKLLTQEPRIIATGGGAFINPSIREAIKKNATSIWLKAELDVLVERVSRRNTRPLLQTGDKREILSKLMDERYDYYAQADIIIDSSNDAHDVVVRKVLESLKEHNA